MSDDGQSIRDVDADPTQGPLSNTPRNVKPICALQLGFYSRFYATDFMRDALLELVNEIHPNIHATLLTTINRMDRHWELAENGDEGWNSSVASFPQPDSNDYWMQDMTLTAFADRAIDATSPCRKLYDLGAFLGDILTERKTSLEPSSKTLQNLLRSFPDEHIQHISTLNTAAESNPGTQDLEGFLDEVLRGKQGQCRVSSTDEPANPTIVRFVQAVKCDLSQTVPTSLFDESPSALRGKLTPAEEKLIDTIRQAGHRLTTKQILAKIRGDDGIASDGTAKNYLASLGRRGLLTNRQDVDPPGYGLSEWE